MDLFNPAGNGVDSSPDIADTGTRNRSRSRSSSSNSNNIIIILEYAWEAEIAEGPAVLPPEGPRQLSSAAVRHIASPAVGISSNNLGNFSLQKLLVGIHGQESEDHEIEESTDHGEPHQDIHEAEGHVEWLPLQCALGLQGHEVAESDGSQCNEAVVVGVKEAPILALGEGSRPEAQGTHAGKEADGHHVLHGNLSVAHATALLQTPQHVAHEGVHPLAQALEHNQRERDAEHGVEHTEGLSSIGSRCSMSIAYGKGKKSRDNSQERFCGGRE